MPDVRVAVLGLKHMTNGSQKCHRLSTRSVNHRGNDVEVTTVTQNAANRDPQNSEPHCSTWRLFLPSGVFGHEPQAVEL
jgi:hypothetical protein